MAVVFSDSRDVEWRIAVAVFSHKIDYDRSSSVLLSPAIFFGLRTHGLKDSENVGLKTQDSDSGLNLSYNKHAAKATLEKKF